LAICHGNVPWGVEKNLRLIICSHSFANPENVAKISPVDFEIMAVTQIVENKK